MKKLVDKFPKTMTERVFIVRTALDTGMQKAADAAVENSLRQYGQEYHARQAAAVLMETTAPCARLSAPRLRRQPVQRATDAPAPARLLVQAIRLCQRADARLQSEFDRGRRPDLHRQLVPAQLQRRLLRLDDMTMALTRSINTIAVRLSIAVGDGNARLGRNRIVKLAHDMGIKTQLPDTPSLPIGADARHRARTHRRLRDLPQSR